MISVAIPAAVKRAHFLREGLSSIYSQTLLPDEIVISVDGTDFETEEVIQSFRRLYPAIKIHYVMSQAPIGQWANRRQAFQLTSHAFVAMLDDDDMWQPDFLEKAYESLRQNPDCGFCFGKYGLMDAKGESLEKMTGEVDAYCGRSQMTSGTCTDVLFRILSFEALPFPLSCTLFRRSVLERAGFIPSFGIDLPDLALFLDLGASRVNAYFIAERLGRYRVHNQQTTTWRVRNAISKVDCFHEVYRRYGTSLREDEMNLLKKRYQTAVMECAISLAHERKRKAALAFLSRFFRLGFGLPAFQRTVVLLALLMGIRNKELSIFANPTPRLRYDNE